MNSSAGIHTGADAEASAGAGRPGGTLQGRGAGPTAGRACATSTNSARTEAPEACGASRWLCALRTFRTVVRERGFTAAARRLGVSQGAVSQQMRCLEAQFGVRLLERSAHHVALTPAGERLLWHAERLLSAQDAMLAEMARLRPPSCAAAAATPAPVPAARPEILH